MPIKKLNIRKNPKKLSVIKKSTTVNNFKDNSNASILDLASDSINYVEDASNKYTLEVQGELSIANLTNHCTLDQTNNPEPNLCLIQNCRGNVINDNRNLQENLETNILNSKAFQRNIHQEYLQNSNILPNSILIHDGTENISNLKIESQKKHSISQNSKLECETGITSSSVSAQTCTINESSISKQFEETISSEQSLLIETNSHSQMKIHKTLNEFIYETEEGKYNSTKETQVKLPHSSSSPKLKENSKHLKSSNFSQRELNDKNIENSLETMNFNIPKHSGSLSTTKVFNSSMKISENPFDFLEDRAFTVIETPNTQEITKKSATTDEQLLSLIKKPKYKKLEVKKDLKEGIFDKIEILSKQEISLPCKKYYKFPFEISQITDDSELSTKLKNTFISAFSSAYSNYRRFGESFAVVLLNDIFIFSKQLKCTNGTIRLLKMNDIKFTEHHDHVIVSDSDKALVSDIIMNFEIPKGKPLPFILSEFEFDNGIVYRTKFIKKAVIKVLGGFEYSYVLTGPLYSGDFKLENDFILHYH